MNTIKIIILCSHLKKASKAIGNHRLCKGTAIFMPF